MLRRIWERLTGRRDWDVYHPKERLIYSYFNGERLVKADPMGLYMKVMDVAGDLEGDLKVANSPLTDAPKAHKQALKTMREVFGLKELTGIEVVDTLSDDETIALFNHFMDYHHRLKKNTSPPATSPEETPVASVYSPDASLLTPPTTGSGPTADEPSTGPPTPSTSAASPPSA